MNLRSWWCIMQGEGFPFLDNKLCQLAYKLASKTKRKGFSPTKKVAGWNWLCRFLQRKPNLQRKNSQNNSAARAIGANPVQIEKFSELLVQWVHTWKIKFMPNNIWNIDESGVQDVSKSQKVIGVKGECVFQTVADDKGVTSTVVTYISAGGWWSPHGSVQGSQGKGPVVRGNPLWIYHKGNRVRIYQPKSLCRLWETVCNIPEREKFVETRPKTHGAVGPTQKSSV